jgi:hypothetical protein
VVPVDDGALEGDEGVLVAVQAGRGYTVGMPGVGLVMIVDSSRPRVSVTATAPSASEAGLVSGAFTFTRTGAVDGPLDVRFSRSGSGTNGLDYAGIGGSTAFITIPAGASSVVLPIVPIADNAVEGPETVVVTLDAAAGYLVEEPAAATVTIADDPARISVIASQPEAREAGPVAGAIVVRRAGGLVTAPLDLEIALSGTAVLADVVPFTPLAFAAGQTEMVVPIVPRADNLVEGIETLLITVNERPTYVVDGSAAGIMIVDDPPIVTVVATDPEASEAGDPGQFTFSRSGGNVNVSLVLFVSRGGTATRAVDYASVGGATLIVTLAEGQTSTTFTIAPIPDSVADPDETVVMTILPRTEYTIAAPGTATVTIREGL